MTDDPTELWTERKDRRDVSAPGVAGNWNGTPAQFANKPPSADTANDFIEAPRSDEAPGGERRSVEPPPERQGRDLERERAGAQDP
jgi:hypothetical protein